MIIVGTGPHLLSPGESIGDGWLPRIGWQNRLRGLPSSSIIASSETSDGPSDAPLRPDTGTFWEPASLPANWKVDLGTIYDDVDYVGVASNLASNSCGIKVETSEDNVTYATMSSEVAPADDAPLMFIDSPRSVKYVRVSVYGASAPRITSIYVGKLLVMDRGFQMGFGPPNLNRTTTMRTALSRGGQFLGQSVREMGVQCSPSFAHLPQDWYRENFEPFVRSARQGLPYFMAWQAENFPYEVAYGWTSDDFSPRYSQQDRIDISWKFKGIGNL